MHPYLISPGLPQNLCVLQCEDNKKIIGNFKGVLNGALTFELVGLKSKIYIVKSLTIAKKQEKRESTHIVGLKIKPEINLECLQQQKINQVRKSRQELLKIPIYQNTLAQNKVCLSPFIHKRYISSVRVDLEHLSCGTKGFYMFSPFHSFHL